MQHEPSQQDAGREPAHLDLRGSRGVIVGDHNRMINKFRTVVRLSLGFRRAPEPGRLTPHERRQAEENLQRLAEALERDDFAVLRAATGPAPLPFTLTDLPSLVANPDRVRSGPDGGPLPAATTVESRFDAASKRLLIVAPFGAGKSTALLLLARHLWQAATVPGRHVRQVIRNRPVPVILRLARWTDDRPLAQWMADELTAIYDIDRRVARILVTHGMVLPMLDGLDEVAPDRRPACVREINDHTDLSGGPPPLVVTCRVDDYDRANPLRLGGAVGIEPLTDRQVLDQLAALPGTEPLRAAYRDDDELRGLLRTPLFLHLVVRVARDRPEAAARGLTAEEIVANYVTVLFEHRPVEGWAGRPRFPDDRLHGWLSAQARLPKPYSAEFVPDELDSAVLREPRRRSRIDHGLPLAAGAAGGFAVTMGTLSAIRPPWTVAQVLYCLAIGAAIGVSFAVLCRRPQQAGLRLVWSWPRAFEWISTREGAVTAGLVAVGVLGWAWWQDGTVGSAPVYLLLVAALATGRGLTTTVGGSASAAPDGALRDSRRNALRVWAAAVASAGLLAVLAVAVNAFVYRFFSVAWLVGIDAAVILWTYGTLLAGLVCGLAVVAAPRRGGQVRAEPRRPARSAGPSARVGWWIRHLARRWSGVARPALVLLAVPAGLALDRALYAVLIPVRLHWWFINTLVAAGVLLLTWAVVRAGAGRGAPARPLGAFLASYCLILIVRLMLPRTDRNQTMYLVITFLLTLCAALVLRGGGLAWVRQHGLRLMVAREGTLPRDLIGFLDDAENRGLLQRRGRGYAFRHEAIRQHFTVRDAPAR